MLVGVVSDTHNNLQNVRRLVELFNQEGVELVIHTGDISQPKTIDCLSDLDCKVIGVFGNNDIDELGLKESIQKNGFSFQKFQKGTFRPMGSTLIGLPYGFSSKPLI